MTKLKKDNSEQEQSENEIYGKEESEKGQF